jgi:hypothetical protein
LSGIHALLAVSLSAPELNLTEHETKVLAENIAAVGKHYDLVASQKSIDWFNLIMACTTIYGTRIIAIGKRSAGTRKAKPTPNAPMPGAGQPDNLAASSVVGVTPNGGLKTRNLSEAEKSSLLNELPLRTMMHDVS